MNSGGVWLSHEYMVTTQVLRSYELATSGVYGPLVIDSSLSTTLSYQGAPGLIRRL